MPGSSPSWKECNVYEGKWNPWLQSSGSKIEDTEVLPKRSWDCLRIKMFWDFSNVLTSSSCYLFSRKLPFWVYTLLQEIGCLAQINMICVLAKSWIWLWNIFASSGEKIGAVKINTWLNLPMAVFAKEAHFPSRMNLDKQRLFDRLCVLQFF